MATLGVRLFLVTLIPKIISAFFFLGALYVHNPSSEADEEEAKDEEKKDDPSKDEVLILQLANGVSRGRLVKRSRKKITRR